MEQNMNSQKQFISIFNKHSNKLIITILIVSFILSILTMLTIFIGFEHALSPDKSSIEFMFEYWLDNSHSDLDVLTALCLNFWWLLILAGIPFYFVVFSTIGLVILAIANIIEEHKAKKRNLSQNGINTSIYNNMGQQQSVNNIEAINLTKEQ